MSVKVDGYCVLGAGPAGLCVARSLSRAGIPYDQYERHSDVGGMWDIQNPNSTMYESAHMISSKKATQLRDFPMPADAPDYPHHSVVARYFRKFADTFGLRERIVFGTTVEHVRPRGPRWLVSLDSGVTHSYRGVIIATGHQHEPRVPEFSGTFDGIVFHSADYMSPTVFEGHRVLVVGAGNSGCDIVVDVVHHARRAMLSLRRGYHIVPKYALFGKPMGDIHSGALPHPIRRRLARLMLRVLVGDPTRFGMPAPDHEIFERHAIVNSRLLYHLGHGDITVKPNVAELRGNRVAFDDGTEEPVDLIVYATGYEVSFPFIHQAHLNWNGVGPKLYLKVFHPHHSNLFVAGLLESVDGGNWPLFARQGDMIAAYIKAREERPELARRFDRLKRGPSPDACGCAVPFHVRNPVYHVASMAALKQLGAAS